MLNKNIGYGFCFISSKNAVHILIVTLQNRLLYGKKVRYLVNEDY